MFKNGYIENKLLRTKIYIFTPTKEAHAKNVIYWISKSNYLILIKKNSPYAKTGYSFKKCQI